MMSAIAGPDHSGKKKEETMDRWRGTAKDGLTPFGLCSYFDRVSTRQELMYCRRVRVAWTSHNVVPCVRTEEEADSLSGFAGKLYQESLLDGCSPGKAFNIVQTSNVTFFDQGMRTMGAKRQRIGYFGTGTLPAAQMLAQFLSGKTLESRFLGPNTQETDASKIQAFLDQLGCLRGLELKPLITLRLSG